MRHCNTCDRTLPDAEFRRKTGRCRECERRYDRERYQTQTKKRKAAVARWKRDNPEVQRAYAQRRRAVKQDASNHAISSEQLRARMHYFASRCWICDEHIEDDELHYDHKKPLSAGGSHVLSNLAPAHALCNLVKSSQWWGIERLDALLEHIRSRTREIIEGRENV